MKKINWNKKVPKRLLFNKTYDQISYRFLSKFKNLLTERLYVKDPYISPSFSLTCQVYARKIYVF